MRRAGCTRAAHSLSGSRVHDPAQPGTMAPAWRCLPPLASTVLPPLLFYPRAGKQRCSSSRWPNARKWLVLAGACPPLAAAPVRWSKAALAQHPSAKHPAQYQKARARSLQGTRRQTVLTATPVATHVSCRHAVTVAPALLLVHPSPHQACAFRSWLPCHVLVAPAGAGYGDSGGPVVYNDAGTKRVVGITSFGPDCGYEAWGACESLPSAVQPAGRAGR